MADETEELKKLLQSCLQRDISSVSQWDDIKYIFERLKMLVKDPESRELIMPSMAAHAKQALVLCEQLVTKMVVDVDDTSVVSCLNATTEVLRFLRNAVAGVPKNQELAVSTGIIEQIMNITSTLLKPCFQESDKNGTIVNNTVKSAIQLLGNVVVVNHSTQDYVWKECFPAFFLSIMCSANLSIQNFTSMVIYNCLVPQLRIELVSSHQGLKIMSQILHLCAEHAELEWGYFIVDILVKKNYVHDLYTGLEFDPSARIILLDLIQVHLTGSQSEVNNPGLLHSMDTVSITDYIPEEPLIFLATEFERAADDVFLENKADSSTDYMIDILLISRLLHLLSSATSLHLLGLQCHTKLLLTALALLRQTNNPENQDHFSKTTPTTHPRQRSEDLNPRHGFKRDLVRLIGNMCYKHKQNQDMVREKEGIPLILDHCNIDEYNPYICQWAVFAIRNILENNLDNQKVVAALDKQGYAKTPEQLGIEVNEMENGKFKVIGKTKD